METTGRYLPRAARSRVLKILCGTYSISSSGLSGGHYFGGSFGPKAEGKGSAANLYHHSVGHLSDDYSNVVALDLQQQLRAVNLPVPRDFGARVEFLTEILPARLSVLVANFWNSTPIVIVMILAALQGISSDLYEAAKVDRSSGWQMFWKVTLPLLKPTIAITLVMQSMEYFNMVTLLNTMTDGGPFKSTMTLSVYAFREGFTYWHVGISSAISILILLLNMIFSTLYIRMMHSRE